MALMPSSIWNPATVASITPANPVTPYATRCLVESSYSDRPSWSDRGIAVVMGSPRVGGRSGHSMLDGRCTRAADGSPRTGDLAVVLEVDSQQRRERGRSNLGQPRGHQSHVTAARPTL